MPGIEASDHVTQAMARLGLHVGLGDDAKIPAPYRCQSLESILALFDRAEQILGHGGDPTVELRAPERADGLQLFGRESRARRLSRENALDLKPRLRQDDDAQRHRPLRGSQIELVLDARPSHFPDRHVREPSFRCQH